MRGAATRRHGAPAGCCPRGPSGPSRCPEMRQEWTRPDVKLSDKSLQRLSLKAQSTARVVNLNAAILLICSRQHFDPCQPLSMDEPHRASTRPRPRRAARRPCAPWPLLMATGVPVTPLPRHSSGSHGTGSHAHARSRFESSAHVSFRRPEDPCAPCIVRDPSGSSSLDHREPHSQDPWRGIRLCGQPPNRATPHFVTKHMRQCTLSLLPRITCRVEDSSHVRWRWASGAA